MHEDAGDHAEQRQDVDDHGDVHDEIAHERRSYRYRVRLRLAWAARLPPLGRSGTPRDGPGRDPSIRAPPARTLLARWGTGYGTDNLTEG